MQNFFYTHRKDVITGAGVLLFMIAGALAMIIIPSEKSPPPQESKIQTKNQNHESESKPESKPQEPESKTLREIYVYMTGAVKKPGVYKFPEGSRIFEVVEAAGGFTPKADIAALNLAETFSDAQHIHIPMKSERTRTRNNADTYTHITVQPKESELNVNQKKQNLVDINSASESELQRLKGVGPAIAKRICEYRKKNGRFKSAEELINVRGIGPVKLEKMRSQILIR